MSLRFQLFCGLILFLFACSPASKHRTHSLTQEARKLNEIIPLPSEILPQGGTLDISRGIFAKQPELVPGFMASDIVSANGKVPLTIKCRNTAPELKNPSHSEYELSITSGGINIECRDYPSLVHGLQTLRQVIALYPSTAIPTMTINDHSRYRWRGLMIDVSRHWIPMSDLKEQIDLMSLYKMNVLHLHLSDYQAFRIESTAYPNLHELASRGQYFSQDDMRYLINYAGQRGIVIVPEFDIPGHATSWLVAYPFLAARDTAYTLRDNFGVFRDAMHPLDKSVDGFLSRFFEEMARLFPSDYIHIGGDEVLPADWMQNEDILTQMEQLKLKTAQDIQLVFNYKLQKILANNGKKMIAWDESLNPQFAGKGVVIQSWRGPELTAKSISLGIPTIHSAGWYLDHKQHIKDLYNVEPTDDSSEQRVVVDSNRWEIYQMNVSFRGETFPAQLFLFGTPESYAGYLMMADKLSGFSNVTERDGTVSFNVKNSFGDMNAAFDLKNKNALVGSLRISLFGLPVTGKKVGGHDMPNGMPLPSWKPTPPLREEDKANIIGGEACVWTEVIDRHTLKSRVWPAAMAIAEKLWSPQSHTTSNTTDFYRRVLSHQESFLKSSTIHQFRHDWVAQFELSSTLEMKLLQFINLLEESKFYHRLTANPEMSIHTPLNELADAASPESLSSYQFVQTLNQLNDDPDNIEHRLSIGATLSEWAALYDELKETFNSHPQLSVNEIYLIGLSDLSQLAIRLLNGSGLTESELAYYNRLKAALSQQQNSIILAPAKSLSAFIDKNIVEM